MFSNDDAQLYYKYACNNDSLSKLGGTEFSEYYNQQKIESDNFTTWSEFISITGIPLTVSIFTQGLKAGISSKKKNLFGAIFGSVLGYGLGFELSSKINPSSSPYINFLSDSKNWQEMEKIIFLVKFSELMKISESLEADKISQHVSTEIYRLYDKFKNGNLESKDISNLDFISLSKIEIELLPLYCDDMSPGDLILQYIYDYIESLKWYFAIIIAVMILYLGYFFIIARDSLNDDSTNNESTVKEIVKPSQEEIEKYS